MYGTGSRRHPTLQKGAINLEVGSLNNMELLIVWSLFHDHLLSHQCQPRRLLPPQR